MPNNFFRFKRFTIHQDNCAMKVCTDACLFGAWVAERFIGLTEGSRILDIGAGTGLLSIMVAQQNKAPIDAVEIDFEASQQAAQNVALSPWKQRIEVHHTAIQQFSNAYMQRYDLILSNPPFFENDLKSDDAKRNLALHGDQLKLEELLAIVKQLLAVYGHFAILLPYQRTEYFTGLATDQGLHLQEAVSVQQTDKHPPFRSMLLFSDTPAETVLHRDIIICSNEEYNLVFADLLRPYYLKL